MVITTSSLKSEPRTRSPTSRETSMTLPSMGEISVVLDRLLAASS